MDAPPLGDQELEELYEWLDGISFTRPKKNITREFSDAVLMAELIHRYEPKLVQLHSYQPTNSSASKYLNWKTLNEKVLKKLGVPITNADIEAIVSQKSGAVERVLGVFYRKMGTERTGDRLLQGEFTENSAEIEQLTSSYREALLEIKSLQTGLKERDGLILQLQDTIETLQNKIFKMEQLGRLKDNRIELLTQRLQEDQQQP